MRTSSGAVASGFLQLARQIQERSEATGAEILDRAADYYRDLRVEDADLDAQGDMLLLQWGRTRPWLLSGPTDLRLGEASVPEADVPRRYLDVTRQIVPTGGSPDVEFDDVALQMSLTLVYEAADGSETNHNLWVETPDGLASALVTLRETPFVAGLLSRVPDRLVATIDWAG